MFNELNAKDYVKAQASIEHNAEALNNNTPKPTHLSSAGMHYKY